MPSQFKCSTCQKTFLYTAKLTSTIIEQHLGEGDTYGEFEVPVCPFCKSPEFALVEEPKPEAEEVAHVYVADLHSGENSEIDALLARGWKIVSRFAKSYTLELPKQPEMEPPEIVAINEKFEEQRAEIVKKSEETATVAEATFPTFTELTTREEEFFERNPGLREKVEKAKREAKKPKDHIDDILTAKKNGELPS